MMNSQHARVGKIFPSSGITEPSVTFTSTSGLEQHVDHQQVDPAIRSSGFIQKIK